MKKTIATFFVPLLLVHSAGVAAKDAPKALAVKTLNTINEAAPLAAKPGYLNDVGAYFRSFNNPLENMINAWPSVIDPDRETYENYAICGEAATWLWLAGDAIRNGTAKKFVDERLAKHRTALERCKKAIETDGKSEAERHPPVEQKLEILGLLLHSATAV